VQPDSFFQVTGASRVIVPTLALDYIDMECASTTEFHQVNRFADLCFFMIFIVGNGLDHSLRHNYPSDCSLPHNHPRNHSLCFDNTVIICDVIHTAIPYIFDIHIPFHRIIDNVLPNRLQRFLTAYYMIIK